MSDQPAIERIADELADITGLDDLIDQAEAARARDRGRPTWTDTTLALLEAVTVAVATKHPRRLAEAAVTRWIITEQSIPEALAVEIESGEWETVRPQRRGHVGFSPGQLDSGSRGE